MKILVCEDEIYARQSLIKQIKNLPIATSFDIIEAKNGKEGFDLFCEYIPEIVLLDIKMPLIDGIDLLKLIMGHSPSTKVLMTSGYANFNYSQEALNHGAVGYLLKPISDSELLKFFVKVLEEKEIEKKNSEELSIFKNNDKLSQMIYDFVILNNLQQQNEFESIFTELFNDFRVTALSFKRSYYQDAVTVTRHIESVFSQKPTINYKTIFLSKHMLCVISQDSGTLNLQIDKICRLLSENGNSCCGGISEKASSYKNLSHLYRQSITAVKSRIFSGKPVVCYDELKSDIIDEKSYSESDFSVSKLLLEKGDFDGAVLAAVQMVGEVKPDNRFSVVLLEDILSKLSSFFVDIIKKHNLTEIQTELMGFDLLRYNDIDGLKQEISRRIKLICAYVSPLGNGKSEHILSIVTSYINENYNKEISLKYLAEKVVFLNHTYLSHLIHEKTGKSYSTFLREIRISKAKELLLTSELSITQVATMCGYNDTSQFIRVFKKEVGVTPKRIKDSNKENLQIERICQDGQHKNEEI